MTGSLPSFTVEQVPIDLLRPDPANPRRIGDEELDALERSIRQFGFVEPVLARKEDHVVIGGHQRLVAARRLGLATVPVTFLDLSIEQARLLNLALNQITGSWDEALLARLLADLQATPDIDLTLSGFGEDEIADLLRSLDTREKKERVEDFDLDSALDEATRTPRTKPGDLWALGEHRLLCGDATKPEDVERLLGGAQAAMAFTDPPYNVSLGDHGGHKRGTRTPSHRQRLHGPDRLGELRPGLVTDPAHLRGRRHLRLHEQQGAAARVAGPSRGRRPLVRHDHLAKGSLRPRASRLPAGLRADLVRLA